MKAARNDSMNKQETWIPFKNDNNLRLGSPQMLNYQQQRNNTLLETIKQV